MTSRDLLPRALLALELGGSAKNITSRYDGTAPLALAQTRAYRAMVDMLKQAGAR